MLKFLVAVLFYFTSNSCLKNNWENYCVFSEHAGPLLGTVLS